MGRSQPSVVTQQAIARMEQSGTQIDVAQADVSNRDQVASVIANIEDTLPPLRGIIQSSGVLDDGVILQQNWSRFETVMGPKVNGTWHLHSLTRHLPLDFFVMFASGASLLGSAGQSNHAAVNAFMDAFAYYRQSLGMPGLSINWGPWAEVGAAAERQIDASHGRETIAPPDGLKALEWALQRDAAGMFAPAQVGVIPGQWQQFISRYEPGHEPPLFSALIREKRRSLSSDPQPKVKASQNGEPHLLDQIKAAVPSRRRLVLRDYVRNQAAKVLGLGNPNQVDLQMPLNQIGLDSLMAVELRNVLGKAVGQTLPATLIFDYPTIEALVEYLSANVLSTDVILQSKDEPTAVVEKTVAADELDELSEDEIASLLEAKLTGLGGDTTRD
jgi:acyl carrier protein